MAFTLDRPAARAARPTASSEIVDFTREVALMYGLFVVYRIARLASRDRLDTAIANAQAVLHFERFTGLSFERTLQRVFLRSHELVRILNLHYLVAHFTVSIAVLLWLYVRDRSMYRRARAVLLVMTSAALVVHVAYPLAPPRFMSGAGFVDTGALLGPSPYGAHSNLSHGLANQIAAMPSMHFGWALLVAWAVIRSSSSRWRHLVALHPGLMFLSIVATANHYVLDALVATAMFVSAVWVQQRSDYSASIESQLRSSDRTFAAPRWGVHAQRMLAPPRRDVSRELVKERNDDRVGPPSRSQEPRRPTRSTTARLATLEGPCALAMPVVRPDGDLTTPVDLVGVQRPARRLRDGTVRRLRAPDDVRARQSHGRPPGQDGRTEMGTA
ncbi:MAG: phosphatase PAP2 family protein [Acidimicrobiia bacterium]